MLTKCHFTAMIGNFTVTGTLRELQKAFIKYRDDNDLGASQMKQFDGLTYRDTYVCGHFSYNGRFWRTDIKGRRVKGRA